MKKSTKIIIAVIAVITTAAAAFFGFAHIAKTHGIPKKVVESE